MQLKTGRAAKSKAVKDKNNFEGKYSFTGYTGFLRLFYAHFRFVY